MEKEDRQGSWAHLAISLQYGEAGQGTQEGSQALISWGLSKLESLGRHDRRGLGLRNQELGTSFFRSQGWGT